MHCGNVLPILIFIFENFPTNLATNRSNYGGFKTMETLGGNLGGIEGCGLWKYQGIRIIYANNPTREAFFRHGFVNLFGDNDGQWLGIGLGSDFYIFLYKNNKKCYLLNI